MTETFTCDQCHGTFERAWTDEDALAEATANFGDQLGDDPAVVCDECYQAMTALHPIGDYLAGKTLAESMAERMAKMGAVERFLYTELRDEFNRRWEGEMDRLLYGDAHP